VPPSEMKPCVSSFDRSFFPCYKQSRISRTPYPTI